MTTIDWVLIGVAGLLVVPAIIYLSAKMAAAGWFRGKIQAERLENDNHEKGKHDGEK